MGILLSKCGNGERRNDTWDELHNKTITLRTELNQISTRNMEIQVAYDQLTEENRKLTVMVNHTKNILKNSDVVADAILLSDLSCQWMDDDKERMYLISIVDFLNGVCSDITCGLYSYPAEKACTVKCTKTLLKMNTVDKLYNELAQASNDFIDDDDDDSSLTER